MPGAGLWTITTSPSDVFLIAGQSNVIGRGLSFDAALDTTDPVILQLPNASLNAAILAQEPLIHVTTNANQIGFSLAFARAYLAATGKNVLLVPSGVSGSGFSDNNWRVGDVSYLNAVTNSNRAMALHPLNVFQGVLWHQGETDVLNSYSSATYQTKLDAMIAGFRADITGANSSAFILGEMVPEWWPVNGGSAIAAVHADTPNRNPKCGFWSGAVGHNNGTDGHSSDPIHYNAIGQRLNGSAAYNAYVNRSP